MKMMVVLTICIMIAGTAGATPVYLRTNSDLPWFQTNNEQAMDGVFGSGSWNDLRYETVNTNSLFSANTNFIFMEGGCFSADEMESFLSNNQANLENWVSNGGRLFLNSAPNEGDGMNLGFGDIKLNYVDMSVSATGTDPNHVIFNGPYGKTGNAFTGTLFGHATISGTGLTSLIKTNENGNMVLAEMNFGEGYVMFGGMTTLNFQTPNSFILRENIIDYASNPVPIPAAIWIFGSGIAGLAGLRRRKKNTV